MKISKQDFLIRSGLEQEELCRNLGDEVIRRRGLTTLQ